MDRHYHAPRGHSLATLVENLRAAVERSRCDDGADDLRFVRSVLGVERRATGLADGIRSERQELRWAPFRGSRRAGGGDRRRRPPIDEEEGGQEDQGGASQQSAAHVGTVLLRLLQKRERHGP